MNIKRYNLSQNNIKTTKMIINSKSKINCEGKINGGVSMLTLSQIREKNRTATALLGSDIKEQNYSDELIKQCKQEFETFVKPIRNRVVSRMLGENNSEV
ncbi:hypothetical protein [Clostridium beijerinckii]|jgi:hypothetical protein|uniref:Uncharacterized protein n=2 Tax=Clostridium beijerinckii TaxID=1520 RepID=A0AAE2V2N1_CLOBE|nr:hypothetical protein [Clostridium beijerinckii]ABR33557.1 hypothetical protein Cbei_1377 [Clostridium beijerinckii NCIMB 8052]AIU04868.1 hypothetical protein Cbs_1377 [Clostridium beijerinckii ATCC 35702]MBF7811973.1 hypothetical protein [Clostridium beijerinckii]NRT25176.1 hypothetical protein [Clostridium beijerinckii]NRT67230.1 hypothetical protein [Clostridium beijerinckii]